MRLVGEWDRRVTRARAGIMNDRSPELKCVEDGLDFARPHVRHWNVATFRQNVGCLSVTPAL